MGRYFPVCWRFDRRRFWSFLAKINDGTTLLIRIVSLLGILDTLSIIVLLYVLAKLSERFGSVIKMPPIYRYYYWAAALVVMGLITQLLTAVVDPPVLLNNLSKPWLLLFLYDVPVSIGLTMSLVITWRYWRWLVNENNE